MGSREILARAYDAARAAWPGVSVSLEAFSRLVEDRAEDELLDLNFADLYLVAGVASGDAAAVAALDARYLRSLELPALGLDAARLDEVRQRLREKLLVATNGAPPRIAQYKGRGELSRFLRVAGTREGLAILERDLRERPSEASLFEGAVDPKASPELAYLKDLYRSELKAAFQEALAALGARDRTLLRYQLVDGFSIDQIGAIFGVHRATAARWLVHVREALESETRARLAARIKVEDHELDSIFRLVQSQLDVSIARILGGPPSA